MTVQPHVFDSSKRAPAPSTMLPPAPHGQSAKEPNQSASEEQLPCLFGHFALLRLLVRGGMGEVFLATRMGIEGAERPCVIKRIRSDYRQDPSFRARFLDEARVQAQLDDPGVARILEASHDEHGDPYVAVEYIEGRSLAEVRHRLQKLSLTFSWADAVAICLEIAQALAHVHERTGADGVPLGIVHRDLSPQNVMVGFGGEVKLIDFGTARGDNRKCHTVSGTVLAKPGYVAPEVARGETATPRADLYALGIMLWELVANQRYLEGDPTEHVTQVASGFLRPLPLVEFHHLSVQSVKLTSGANPLEEVDRIVGWLTEPLPSQRCLRARDAAAALAALLSQTADKKGEERGIRARIRTLLSRTFPNEPGASRSDFARLVQKARKLIPTDSSVAVPASRPPESAQEDRLTQVPDALPGTRYRLVKRLGEGAMGVVYEAEHVDLGRRVAIKVLLPQHSSSEEFVARFRREARAIASIAHPNLVHVYDFGQTRSLATDGPWAGRLFFVMEKLEGETLEAYLERERGLDWRDACEIAIKTCRALEAAHNAGLVHRDLKPANLFLTYTSRNAPPINEMGLKLLDFGVAKGLAAHLSINSEDKKLSRSGAIFGTPDTIAPEQACGSEVDGRADLYALGCVLYELLSGRPVFEATSAVMLISAHLKETPVPVRTRAPLRGIPESVERVVMRALEKDAVDRFASATEMREALEEACFCDFYQGKPIDGEKTPALDSARAIAAKNASSEKKLEVNPTPNSAKTSGSERIEDEPVVQSRSIAPPRDEESLSVVPPKRKRRIWPATLVALVSGVVLSAAALGVTPLTVKQWIANRLLQPTESLSTHALAQLTSEGVPLTSASAPVASASPSAVASQENQPPSRLKVQPQWRSGKVRRAEKNGRLHENASTHEKSSLRRSTQGFDSRDHVSLPSIEALEYISSEHDSLHFLRRTDLDEALTKARKLKTDRTLSSIRHWAETAYYAGAFAEAYDASKSWLETGGESKAGLLSRLLAVKSLHALGRSEEAKLLAKHTTRMYPKSQEARALFRELYGVRRVQRLGAIRGLSGNTTQKVVRTNG